MSRKRLCYCYYCPFFCSSSWSWLLQCYCIMKLLHYQTKHFFQGNLCQFVFTPFIIIIITSVSTWMVMYKGMSSLCIQSTIFLLSANNQLHFYENVVRLFIRSSVDCGVKSKIQSRVGVVMMMKMIAQKEVENVFRG